MPTYELNPIRWAANNMRRYADPENTLVGASDIALVKWLEYEADLDERDWTPAHHLAVAYAESHIRLEASVPDDPDE